MSSRLAIVFTLTAAIFAALPPRIAHAQGSRGTVVEIDSDPRGAAVFIDDSPFGETPLRIEGKIKPGRHLFRLQLDGHEKYEKIVDVSSVARFNVKLTPLEAPYSGRKPLVLERKGTADSTAPLPAGGDPGPPRKETPKPRDTPRETPLPGEALADDGGDVPLGRTLVAGISLGLGGETVDSRLSSSYLALIASVQRNVSERLAVQLGAGLNIQTSLDPRPGADRDERGSLRGFELFVGFPFYALKSGSHHVYVAPEAGISNHRYQYTDFSGSGALVESAAFRYIQTRISAAIGYQYLPFERHAGTVGYGVKIGMSSYGDAGDVPGSVSVQGSGGLLVRF